MGADRLVLEFTWVVDEAGQVPICKFLNGEQLIESDPTNYSELDKKLAERTYDVSGDYVVKPFPKKMLAHPSDDTKLILRVSGGGKGYVQGFKQALKASQDVEIPKGRDVKSVNSSVLSAFSMPGGTVITTNAEPFNVDGLAVRIMVEEGNYHTVTLSGTAATAAEVASQISGGINTYPTSGSLLNCTSAIGKMQVRAAAGKRLVIGSVANDAYAALGINTGIYEAEGTRIYKANHQYIKSTSDFSYISEKVVAITHDGTDHKDLLGEEEVSVILGASATLADCHDGKFDWQLNIDFIQNGNQIDYTSLGGSTPANGQTYFVKFRYAHNALRGTRVRVRVVDAQVNQGL